MPGYVIPAGRGNSHDSRYYYHNYDDGPRMKQYEHDHVYNSAKRPSPRRWPPAPSVEDEDVSLKREYLSGFPGSNDEKVSERGSVDQMPVLVEIGKEYELDEGESATQDKSRRAGKSSLEDRHGSDKPTDSSATASDAKRQRDMANVQRAPSVKDIINGQRRTENVRRDEKPPALSERPKPGLHPIHPPFQRSTSSQATPTSQYLRPTGPNEARAHSNEREAANSAPRQRAMSGSNHQAFNMRHMSALEYTGESHTPILPKDHNMIYTSPVSAGPPVWRRPRERLHTAIADSSESDMSPDEIAAQNTRQRTMSRTHRPSMSSQKPPPLSREGSRKSGQSSQEAMNRKPLQVPAPGRAASRHSPTSSSQHSGYPSPPASPSESSRPSSRDGPFTSVPPLRQLSQKTQRPIGSTPEHHASSNLRYSSRPSSPVRQASTSRHDLLQPGLLGEKPRSREPSPVQVPPPSRSPQAGMRVNTAPAIPRAHAMSNGMNQRPPSVNGPVHPSPSITRTTATWPTDKAQMQRPQHVTAATPIIHQARPMPRGLIACPRPEFTTKYNDWWTLPGVSDFDLCPDCKDSLQANGFEGRFVKSQPRPPGTKTRCDMNVPWIRIAWLLILARREKVDILIDLMDVLSNEPECPGREGGVRKKWYRVYDADNDKHVQDFNLCPVCVRSTRIIFPNLKDTFVSYIPTSEHPKICDFTACTPRFAKYIDLLDKISADSRQYREEPDTRKFVRLTKDFAGIRPCQRDNQFRAIPWHYIPHVPDFTICEECFVEVVKPAQRAGFDLAEQIDRKTMMPLDMNLKLSCQLYSTRMRLIFEECCRNQDLAGLREHALARVNKERELQQRVELVRELPQEWQAQEIERLIDEWKRWE